jgi:hypothetical protein
MRNPTKRQQRIVEHFVKRVLKESEWEPGGKLRAMQDQFGKMNINDIVPIINAQTKWDYENIAQLVKELLIDANFHDESSKVYEFMMNLE